MIIRPETPPNTPQRAQIAARHAERNRRVLDSPEHHHLPNAVVNQIPPPRLYLANVPQPLPGIPNHNADPFAAPGQSAIYNGQIFPYFAPTLAAQPAALPALSIQQYQHQAPPQAPLQPGSWVAQGAALPPLVAQTHRLCPS